MKAFKAGEVRPLFRLGSYDGMMTGVGLLDGRHVYLDARDQAGGWTLKPKWRQLEDLLDELLSEEDSENIWDRIERKYDEQMNESLPRRFAVRALSDEQFESLLERHRPFQLHVGLHCDFAYDEEGRPSYSHDGYWGLGQEYIKAHFYDAVPARSIDAESLPLLGHVDSSDFYAPGTVRPPVVSDPRSPALKAYQETWKDGDLVRLDW